MDTPKLQVQGELKRAYAVVALAQDAFVTLKLGGELWTVLVGRAIARRKGSGTKGLE